MNIRPKSIVVHAELVRVAKARRTITYGELAEKLHLGIARNTAHYLNEVGEIEIANGRPLLTAVVGSKEKRMSGEGFFALARQNRLSNNTDRRTFWENELRKVHDYWSQQK